MISIKKQPGAIRVVVLITTAACFLFGVAEAGAHKRERDGNVVVFNGNRFEMNSPSMGGITGGTFTLGCSSGKSKNDSQQVKITIGSPKSSSAADLNMGTVKILETPIKMNEETIHSPEDLSAPISLVGTEQDLLRQAILLSGSELAQLKDGKYGIQIHNLVVDPEGHAVYYEIDPVFWGSNDPEIKQSDKTPGQKVSSGMIQQIDESSKKILIDAFEKCLDKILFAPGQIEGKPVLTYSNSFVSVRSILVVKNQQVIISGNI